MPAAPISEAREYEKRGSRVQGCLYLLHLVYRYIRVKLILFWHPSDNAAAIYRKTVEKQLKIKIIASAEYLQKVT